MKPIKKAVAVVGKYTDKEGKEKTQYHTCGKLFQREDGSLSLKLDAVPVGLGFSGWLNFYDLEENRQVTNKAGMEQARQAAEPTGKESGSNDFDDSSIPF